jgi:hypothetical protein
LQFHMNLERSFSHLFKRTFGFCYGFNDSIDHFGYYHHLINQYYISLTKNMILLFTYVFHSFHQCFVVIRVEICTPLIKFISMYLILLEAVMNTIILLLLVHINYTKGNHCDVVIHACNVLRSNSRLLLLLVLQNYFLKTILMGFKIVLSYMNIMNFIHIHPISPASAFPLWLLPTNSSLFIFMQFLGLYQHIREKCHVCLSEAWLLRLIF